MSLRTKGLVLAMEAEGDDVTAVPGELSEAMAETVETSADAEVTSGQVEELDEAIDDASDDVETLERIHDVMEESVEKGEGLDETSAEIAEIAVEAIFARLGIQKRAMPAMESFGSSNSRVVATKIAMETIGESIKKVWEAIKTAFASMWASIEAFLTKWFTALGSVRRTITALEAEVAGLGKTEPSEKEIDNKGLAKALAIGGKADASTTSAILKAHTTFTGDILKSFSEIKKVAAELTTGESDLGDFSKEEDAFIASIESKGPFVDGTVIEFEKPQDKKGFSISFSVKFGEKSEELSKLATLDKAQMKTVIADVKALLTVSEGYKKEMAVMKEINATIGKAADLMIKLSAKAQSSEAETGAEKDKIGERSKVAYATAQSVKTLLGKTTTQVPNINVKAMKASLSYVQASAKAYK